MLTQQRQQRPRNVACLKANITRHRDITQTWLTTFASNQQTAPQRTKPACHDGGAQREYVPPRIKQTQPAEKHCNNVKQIRRAEGPGRVRATKAHIATLRLLYCYIAVALLLCCYCFIAIATIASIAIWLNLLRSYCSIAIATIASIAIWL